MRAKGRGRWLLAFAGGRRGLHDGGSEREKKPERLAVLQRDRVEATCWGVVPNMGKQKALSR